MQSGTRDFVNTLKRRVFPRYAPSHLAYKMHLDLRFDSCESVITRLKGHQLTMEYLSEMGFTRPILITNRDGLDITLPSRTITLAEINELAGKQETN